MKHIIYLLAVLAVFACEPRKEDKGQKTKNQTGEFYQLRKYTFDSEDQVNQTDAYLKAHYLPELRKLGIEHVGVFKEVRDELDSTFTTYVLFPFKSLDQLQEIDRISVTESDEAAVQDYLNAPYDQPPYLRFETVIMRSFVDMPRLAIPTFSNDRQERIYELRSYESSSEGYYWNKVEMFNEGGEITLFDRLGFNAVFFGEVLAGSRMPNLMYMTTFENMESRDAHWKAFFDSDEWDVLSAMEKYKNNVSKADVILLRPTDYSDY